MKIFANNRKKRFPSLWANFLAAIVLLALTFTSYAGVITVLPNDGATSQNSRAPQGALRYERSIWLITATEMAAAGYNSGGVVTSIGFNYSVAQDITTTGSFVVYLENTADVTNLKSTTWATAITGMTTAHNANITIPNATGTVDFTFSGGSTFTYTGGGVYVAFDYQFPAGTLSTANTALCNLALASGLLGAQSNTSAPATTAASNWRPETRFGIKNCGSAPSAQPTNLITTPLSTTSISGSFTAAAGASGYLVVRTTTSAAPTNPVNGTTYTVGSSALGGVIVASGTSTSFTATGLTANTQYWFWVYSYDACATGPTYLTSSPLSGTEMTMNSYIQSGSGSWVAPCGVTSVVVECWGGGGGGGNSGNSATNGGSGGGGGAYSKSTMTVTPGGTYYFSTGSAGNGGPAGVGSATAGGDSWFNRTGVNAPPGSAADGVLSKGGGLGGNNGGAAGIGGASASGYGTDKYSGGNGGVGAGNGGAGGGSSAGTAANGATATSGSGTAGATAPAGGGNGGAGSSGGNGVVGSLPGGGGGGSNDVSTATGGNGALGQVILYYPSYVANVAPTGASATVTSGCSGYSTTLTQTGGTLGTAATWYWYSGSCGGTLVGTSTAANASLATTVTANTTYYVRAQGGKCASTTACGSVAVTATQPPTTSAAGNDQSTCSMCPATLAANNPAVGTGAWTVSSGPSTLSSQFASTTTYNTTFTPAGGSGDYVLTWTITNSPCAASADNVTITINTPGTWSLGASATYIKTNATASSWQSRYDGGISTITSSGFWILRKTGAANPGGLVSNGGYYPNLTIESNNGAWTTTTVDGSTFTGSAGYPTVLGTLNVGGSGSGTVTFLNENTNATQTYVGGNVTIQTGSTLQSHGTGFEIHGDFTNNGTYNYTGFTPTETFKGSAAQSIGGTTATTFYNLTIDNSAAAGTGVTQVQPVTVSNVFALTDGEFKLNSLTAIVTNAATTAITRANGYVVSETTDMLSKLQWNMVSTTGNHIFPFGKTDGTYIPFEFNLTAGTIGNVDAATYPTAADNTPFPSPVTSVCGALGPDNSPATIDRFWVINKSGASGTATMKFSFADAEKCDAPYWLNTEMIIQRWNNALATTCKWEPEITGQTSGTTAGVHWITVPDVTAFSPWGGARRSFPLPISLLIFDAAYNGTYVDLTWVTASEINNDYFTVEKAPSNSPQGGEPVFSPVVKVKSKAPNGNSSAELSYNTIDDSPFPSGRAGDGLIYYRLKQTDFDGRFSYSDIVAVNIARTYNFSIQPNPAKNTLNVSLSCVCESEVNIEFTNIIGKSVMHDKYPARKGDNTIPVDIRSLGQGLYFIKVSSGDPDSYRDVYMEKFVKE